MHGEHTSGGRLLNDIAFCNIYRRVSNLQLRMKLTHLGIKSDLQLSVSDLDDDGNVADHTERENRFAKRFGSSRGRKKQSQLTSPKIRMT